MRAKIVLLAAGGLSNEEIAVRLDIPRQLVSKWRKRFYEQHLAGLRDRSRSGRPPAFPPEVVVAIKALAYELSATCGVPLSHWHVPDLARAAVERGIVASISGTTIWRWLSADAIRPWQHRSWVFPRDPDFAEKASRMLDLYQRRFAKETLVEKDFVICADEKIAIQALHPGAPASTLPHRQLPDSRCASNTSTKAKGRCLTLPRGMFTVPSSLVVASLPPGSNRSTVWSSKSWAPSPMPPPTRCFGSWTTAQATAVGPP